MNSLILKLVLALSFATQISATTYAQFCDDDSCSVNCGISVSTDNPGCLAEDGRLSIKFHDTNVQEVSLIASPEGDSACSCQNWCYGGIVQELNSSSYCVSIANYIRASSFRFVGGGSCPANNC